MHSWQRQPGEPPDAFTAFAAYLRLKGRRSHATTAARTGRPLGAIRRLSAQWNWPARVAAFETRLAEATQVALDREIQAVGAPSRSNLEQLRIKEFLFADQVIHESNRWLQRASDPRRRQVSLTQVCRLIELAFKLKCFAAGMPGLDALEHRQLREDAPGSWTGLSPEEALEKICGTQLSEPSPPWHNRAPVSSPIRHDSHPVGSRESVDAPSGSCETDCHLNAAPAPAPRAAQPVSDDGQLSTDNPSLAVGGLNNEPRDPPADTGNMQTSSTGPLPDRPVASSAVPFPPGHRRRDVWSAWAAYQRRSKPP